MTGHNIDAQRSSAQQQAKWRSNESNECLGRGTRLIRPKLRAPAWQFCVSRNAGRPSAIQRNAHRTTDTDKRWIECGSPLDERRVRTAPIRAAGESRAMHWGLSSRLFADNISERKASHRNGAQDAIQLKG